MENNFVSQDYITAKKKDQTGNLPLYIVRVLDMGYPWSLGRLNCMFTVHAVTLIEDLHKAEQFIYNIIYQSIFN